MLPPQPFSGKLFSVLYFKGVFYNSLFKWQLELHINKAIKETHRQPGESSRWVRGNLSSVPCECKTTTQSYCCTQRQMFCGCRLASRYRSQLCNVCFPSREPPVRSSSASDVCAVSHTYGGTPLERCRAAHRASQWLAASLTPNQVPPEHYQVTLLSQRYPWGNSQFPF